MDFKGRALYIGAGPHTIETADRAIIWQLDKDMLYKYTIFNPAQTILRYSF